MDTIRIIDWNTTSDIIRLTQSKESFILIRLLSLWWLYLCDIYFSFPFSPYLLWPHIITSMIFSPFPITGLTIALSVCMAIGSMQNYYYIQNFIVPVLFGFRKRFARSCRPAVVRYFPCDINNKKRRNYRLHVIIILSLHFEIITNLYFNFIFIFYENFLSTGFYWL